MQLESLPFVLTPYAGAFLGHKITYENMEWYDKLKHPVWTPPKWVFGPVWGILYGSMGYASYLVYRDSVDGQATLPLAIYGSNLILNWSWTSVFFGQHKLKLSVFIIMATLGTSAACAFLFRPINACASNLMTPYVAWLALAASVNIGTYYLNRPALEQK